MKPSSILFSKTKLKDKSLFFPVHLFVALENEIVTSLGFNLSLISYRVMTMRRYLVLYSFSRDFIFDISPRMSFVTDWFLLPSLFHKKEIVSYIKHTLYRGGRDDRIISSTKITYSTCGRKSETVLETYSTDKIFFFLKIKTIE